MKLTSLYFNDPDVVPLIDGATSTYAVAQLNGPAKTEAPNFVYHRVSGTRSAGAATATDPVDIEEPAAQTITRGFRGFRNIIKTLTEYDQLQDYVTVDDVNRLRVRQAKVADAVAPEKKLD